jgi:hypothetical protein
MSHGIPGRGEARGQFCHVIDIALTILGDWAFGPPHASTIAS